MTPDIYIHNSLTREKELFKPLHEGHVGMYVCGPTVYSDVHLGNCRTFVNFDLVFRLLKYAGYKVRYVRNITDVGHLENDADTGEDKIAKRARLEQIEPMEVVQRYTLGFHEMMSIFNTLPPSIEPRASGHILEQIEMVQQIIDNGYGYVSQGSVYFDTVKFHEDKGIYGQLSGRILEDLLVETRDLKNQDEKRHPSDFAIWMRASPEHILRWNSPWSVGFPGWHLECSAMSTKYLGLTFDIHGGGSDLKFPHHENEIAQNWGACSCTPSRYWMHANMLLLNGKKMSKSDGNSINPPDLFTGNSPHLTKGYSPMVVRFFMMQSHYRSTLDITDDALQAAEKGYRRLMESYKVLLSLKPSGQISGELDKELQTSMALAISDMCDDFNAPKALARLFEMVPRINAVKGGQVAASAIGDDTLAQMKKCFADLIFDILGLIDETASSTGNESIDRMGGLMEMIIAMRLDARARKDWAASDRIRDQLASLGISIKDGKEGATWMVE